MKKIILFFSILLLIACSKDSVFGSDPTLPPETQTGANKVGCLINGQVLLPRGSNPFGPPIYTCYYQYLNGSYQFGLGFTNNSNGVKGVTILSNKLEFIQGQTYILKQEENTNSCFAYYQDGFSNGFGTNTINIGELKITKLDQSNAIISGTFWFNAVKASNGEVVHITEGRFDMQYSQ